MKHRLNRAPRSEAFSFRCHPLMPAVAGWLWVVAAPAGAQSPEPVPGAPAAAASAPAVVAPASAEQARLPAVSVKASRVVPADKLVTQGRISQVGKSGVSVQDTPFSVSVIDVAQIRETGAKNVQDALLYSAGVYAGRYGFDTRGDWAAIRGLSPSTYLDGLRGIYGFYNNVRPEIYALSAVEVLKGPSSVLYGQADLGGIVNVVTKLPQAVPLKEIEVQMGSHHRKQLAADFTGPLNADASLLYRFVALKRDSDTQVDHVHDDALLLQPSLTWQPNAGTRLTALFVHQQNDSRVSSQFLPSKGTLDPAPLGQIPSNRFAGEPGWDRYDTRKNEFSLFLDQRLASSWKLVASVRKTNSSSVTREIYTSVGPIPDDEGNIGRTVHAADRETDVLAADVRLEGTLLLGPTRHTIAVGLDHQDAVWEESNYFSQSGVGSFNVYNPVYGSTGALDLAALALEDRPDNQIKQIGVYAMDHIEWGSWVASVALRRDRARNMVMAISGAKTTDVVNDATTGRIGLMYRLANGMAPYASYSEAFSPNLGTNGSLAAGYLKPTTGDQREAGVKFLSNSGDTSATLAWFDIAQQNRVVDGAFPGGREQVGAKTRGWEMEARHRAGALELLANFTQMNAVNAVTGQRLSAIAERTASTWVTYTFRASGWRAGFGARYIGDVTGNNGAPVLPSVSLFDAMVAYATGPWDFRLDAKNLADKTYVSWCRGLNQDCGYGEGLNIGLTARYRF